MKTNLLKLALCALIFGTFNQSFAMQTALQQPATETSFLDKVPSPYQVVQYGYHAANLAAWGLVIYVGYRAYTNENLSQGIKTLYNLATLGDTVTPQERKAIREKKDKKHKDIQETAETVRQQTKQLNELLSGIEVLKLASEKFATQDDLRNLVTKSDFQEFEKRMNARLDTIIEQTRAEALAEGFLKAQRTNRQK